MPDPTPLSAAEAYMLADTIGRAHDLDSNEIDLRPIGRVVARLLDTARADERERLRALRNRVADLADSIHGDSGWEHNSGCEGEPDCFACIELDLRAIAAEPCEPPVTPGEATR